MNPNLRPDALFSKIVVCLYAGFQFLHVFVPLIAPSVPWYHWTVRFDDKMLPVHIVNGIVTFVFVYGFFRKAKWRLWLGTVSVTISLYDGIASLIHFIEIEDTPHTLWFHLVSYFPALPVLLLFLLVAAWSVDDSA